VAGHVRQSVLRRAAVRGTRRLRVLCGLTKPWRHRRHSLRLLTFSSDLQAQRPCWQHRHTTRLLDSLNQSERTNEVESPPHPLRLIAARHSQLLGPTPTDVGRAWAKVRKSCRPRRNTGTGPHSQSSLSPLAKKTRASRSRPRKDAGVGAIGWRSRCEKPTPVDAAKQSLRTSRLSAFGSPD